MYLEAPNVCMSYIVLVLGRHTWPYSKSTPEFLKTSLALHSQGYYKPFFMFHVDDHSSFKHHFLLLPNNISFSFSLFLSFFLCLPLDHVSGKYNSPLSPGFLVYEHSSRKVYKYFVKNRKIQKLWHLLRKNVTWQNSRFANYLRVTYGQEFHVTLLLVKEGSGQKRVDERCDT